MNMTKLLLFGSEQISELSCDIFNFFINDKKIERELLSFMNKDGKINVSKFKKKITIIFPHYKNELNLTNQDFYLSDKIILYFSILFPGFN